MNKQLKHLAEKANEAKIVANTAYDKAQALACAYDLARITNNKAGTEKVLAAYIFANAQYEIEKSKYEVANEIVEAFSLTLTKTKR